MSKIISSVVRDDSRRQDSASTLDKQRLRLALLLLELVSTLETSPRRRLAGHSALALAKAQADGPSSQGRQQTHRQGLPSQATELQHSYDANHPLTNTRTKSRVRKVLITLVLVLIVTLTSLPALTWFLSGLWQYTVHGPNSLCRSILCKGEDEVSRWR